MDIIQAEYPFESHFYDRDGLAMHYLDEGDGPPIVMVHGNPTWSFYYRKLVTAVRDSHRVIVPDHIGCGLSEKPDDRRYTYTLASRVDDLEALLDHLKIDQDITLVMHDWGGMIGMNYATRHPERIRRMLILNTAAFHLLPGKKLPEVLQFVRDTLAGAYLVRGLNAFARGAAWVGTTSKLMDQPLRDAYCAPYDNWDNRIATLRFVQDIPLEPTDRAYNLISQSQAALEAGVFKEVPALICWGMRDFVFDKDYLEKWIEYLPHAEVFRFPDGGHYVLEDAAEEITALFQQFLKDHPLT